MSFWKLLKTKYSDTDSDYIRADRATMSLQTIDYQHHEIYAGSNFFVDDLADLSINNIIDLQFKTPNTTKWNHWMFSLDCEAEFQWWIYENVTVLTIATVAITPYNSDRNSATTSGNLVLANFNISEASADTYVNTSGSIRLAMGAIGAGKTGGLTSRDNEKILKQNTTYLLRGKAISAGYVSFMMHWYEHTNKH